MCLQAFLQEQARLKAEEAEGERRLAALLQEQAEKEAERKAAQAQAEADAATKVQCVVRRNQARSSLLMRKEEREEQEKLRRQRRMVEKAQEDRESELMEAEDRRAGKIRRARARQRVKREKEEAKRQAQEKSLWKVGVLATVCFYQGRQPKQLNMESVLVHNHTVMLWSGVWCCAITFPLSPTVCLLLEQSKISFQSELVSLVAGGDGGGFDNHPSSLAICV